MIKRDDVGALSFHSTCFTVIATSVGNATGNYVMKMRFHGNDWELCFWFLLRSELNDPTLFQAAKSENLKMRFTAHLF